MKNFNLSFVVKIIGFLLTVESIFMLFSTFIGEYYNEPATKGVYISVVITSLLGLLLLLLSKVIKGRQDITKHEGYLAVTLGWTMMALLGTLPYILSDAIPSFDNAFFESMAGFTTTGGSTLINVEAFPKCLHFWRSFTQWIGGVGIIVFVMGFMPLFGGSAVELFDAEVTGIMQNQITPRIKDMAKNILLIYSILTIIGFLLLWAGPMDAFDAACHTLSGISCGGFSTKQSSIAYYNSAFTEYVLMIMMFLGGTNFFLIYTFFRKRSIKVFKDEEFKWYCLIILIYSVIIASSLLLNGQMQNIEYTIRTVLFQVISIITTTGYATFDYLTWGHVYWFVFLSLMIFCACEGSTSGGMKISRLVVMVKNSLVEFRKQVHPNALLMVKMNGKVVQQSVVSKVLAFMFLYTSLTGISFVVLSLSGMSFSEAVGAAIASLGNVGPGLGEHGPAGNFAEVSSFAKYYMSFLMLVGRLELFTVLSLFVPNFWKR
ncbi:MAG: TrkH family potassium uptake protein [Dysgonamonadaceae bacterium]|nr:TrkH family potassium uptake protein [Dysgonamonadaceae bacterium]MDD4399731.1 TrkH family potassium uptake protein [Dysgonamonadaceae bacterium]